jgi:Mrp family chromosome partitioning ATPase
LRSPIRIGAREEPLGHPRLAIVRIDVREEPYIIRHLQLRSEPFRILRANITPLYRPPKANLIGSAKRREGRTTIVCDLAIAFAAVGKRVILVDAESAQPTLAARVRLIPSNGLTNERSK